MRRQIAQMNVVPYVDVMLVLLVIFMVTTPFMQTSVVNLPRVGQTATAAPAPLEVVIRTDRSLWIRDHAQAGKNLVPVIKSQLASLVQKIQTKQPQKPVVIAADRQVRYEDVMDVMDALQRANINNVGLLVQSAQ